MDPKTRYLVVLSVCCAACFDPARLDAASVETGGADPMTTGSGSGAGPTTTTSTSGPNPETSDASGDGSTSGPDASSGPASSGSDAEGSGSSGSVVEESSGSSGTTTGGAALDCDELCGGFDSCDDEVSASCEQACETIVPTLVAFDEECGAAHREYVECRYALTCAELVEWLDTGLGADPCSDEEATAADACIDAAPANCDDACDVIVECDPDGFQHDDCVLNCSYYYATGAYTGDPECEAEIEAAYDCIAGASCSFFEECSEELAIDCV